MGKVRDTNELTNRVATQPDTTETTQEYQASIIINGVEIIPSDTFETDAGEYVLLAITKNDTGTELKLMGLAGPHVGKMYHTTLKDFERMNKVELEEYFNQQ